MEQRPKIKYWNTAISPRRRLWHYRVLPPFSLKIIFQMHEESTCFKIFNNYRSYNDNIPAYLQGRPRNTILHCLDRKGSSNKFTSEDITDIDTKEGVFSVCSPKGRIYTVNFGINSDDRMPSCTCVDWRTHHIPCKHFFAIFQHRSPWSWDSLPKQYLESAYISTDSAALLAQGSSSSEWVVHRIQTQCRVTLRKKWQILFQKRYLLHFCILYTNLTAASTSKLCITLWALFFPHNRGKWRVLSEKVWRFGRH